MWIGGPICLASVIATGFWAYRSTPGQTRA
jgi:hypothetical protein